MAARRKANILGSRSLNGSSKPLPTILNRKRKNDDEEPEINSYFTSINPNIEQCENLQGVSFANIQLNRPNSR